MWNFIEQGTMRSMSYLYCNKYESKKMSVDGKILCPGNRPIKNCAYTHTKGDLQYVPIKIKSEMARIPMGDNDHICWYVGP